MRPQHLNKRKNKQNQQDPVLGDSDEDVDLTTFEKVEKTIKTSIFNVLFVLLKDNETEMWKEIIITVIDFIITLQFTFYHVVAFPWKNKDVEEYVNFVMDNLQAAIWISRLDLKTYWVLFYGTTLLVILIILDIIYVSYSFSKKRFAFIWPLQALRSTVPLFVTALFLPLLEVFISILYCLYDETDGNYYLDVFLEYQCYTNEHFIHLIIGTIVQIFFVLICSVIAFTFYDISFVSGDFKATANNKSESFFLGMKLVLSYVYTFYAFPEYQWFVIFCILSLSYIAYMNYRNNWSYFNDITNKMFNLYTGLWLWCNVCLVLVKIMEHEEFSGGYQICFLGLPLIVLLIIFEPDKRRKLLLQNIQNFDKGEDVAIQLRYLVKLIQTRDTNRKNNVILQGYIYQHEDNCPNPECQLKKYKATYVQFSKKKKELKFRKTDIEIHFQQIKTVLDQCLFEHAKSMYKQGLAKFPQCSSLRLEFGFFLKEIMNNKKEAHQQWNITAKCNPTFAEQFQIFRQRKSAQDDGLSSSSSSNDGDSGIVAKFAFESTLIQLEQEVKKSAQLHYDFWGILRVESPDISKLSEVGLKINKSLVVIEELFKYLVKLNPNSPAGYKIYSKFLTSILNDQDRAQQYNDKIQEIANGKSNVFQQGLDPMENSTEFEYLMTTGMPCVIVSGSQNEDQVPFEIVQVNLATTRLFGYIAEELEGYCVDKLLPRVYAKYHKKLMETAVQRISKANPADIQSQQLINTKERLVFGKHKNGYIFPVIIQIKYMQSVSGGIQFLSLFKVDKRQSLSEYSFILLNKEKRIQEMSSNCVNTFGLDQKRLEILTSANINIEKLAPTLYDELNEMNEEKLKPIVWNILEIQKRNENRTSDASLSYTDNYMEKQFKIRGTKKFLTTLQPIQMGEMSLVGWYIKMINKEMKGDSLRSTFQRKEEIRKYIRQPYFQFRFDDEEFKYYRELRDPKSDEKPHYRKFLQNLLMTTNFEELKDESSETSRSLNNEDIQVQMPKPNSLLAQKRIWGGGIQIYKLENGVVSLKDETEEMRKLQKIEQMKRMKEAPARRKSIMDDIKFENNPQTRKALQMAFMDKSTPRPIQNLRYTMTIIILAIFTLALVEFIINNQQFRDINENFYLIQKSYSRISEIQRIAYDVRTLVNINEKRQTNYNDYSSTSDFTDFLRLDIHEALDSLYNLQRYLSLSDLQITERHKDLEDGQNVLLYFIDHSDNMKIFKYSLKEAVLQMSSAIFSVRYLNIEDFINNQQDIFFVTYNSYNDFLEALRQSSIYYVENLYERSSEKYHLIIAIFIVSVILFIFTAIFLIPVVSNVYKARIEILCIFVDIPNESIQELIVKCEDFIFEFDSDDKDMEQLRSQREESVNFQRQDSTVSIDQIGNPTLQQKKRRSRKTPKNLSRSNTKFVVQFVSALSVVLAYFAFMFALSMNYLSYIDIETRETNLLSQSESFYAFALNAQREMIYDPEKPILNRQSFQVARDSIEQLFLFNAKLLEYHINDHTENDYQSFFHSVMETNLCDDQFKEIIKYDLIPVPCEDIFEKSPSHGLQTVLVRYFETLKLNMKFYLDSIDQSNYTMTVQLQQKLFDSSYFRDLYFAQFRFIQDVFRHLDNLLRVQVQQNYDSCLSTRVWAFVFFILAIIIAYIGIWIPFVSNLNRSVRTIFLNFVDMENQINVDYHSN